MIRRNGLLPALLLLAGCFSFVGAAELPRLVTARDTVEESGRDHVKIRLPALVDTGNRTLEERINRRIREAAENAVAEARRQVAEYRAAQRQSGGAADERIPLWIDIDYRLHFRSARRISFEVSRTHTLASAYTERSFFNLELPEGRELTPAELLGPDFRPAAEAEIRRQIAARIRREGAVFFPAGQGGFESISPRQPFYLNGAGKVVIVFRKYEIAPGSMGSVEFVIEPGGRVPEKPSENAHEN